MSKQELYEDWFSDNREDLMADFIENHLSDSAQQDWDNYLKEEFSRWRDDQISNIEHTP